jgi:hypothetical protein
MTGTRARLQERGVLVDDRCCTGRGQGGLHVHHPDAIRQVERAVTGGAS